MRDNDAVLSLLSDIKELLYGLFLLILGAACCLGGLLLGAWGLLAILPGIFCIAAGCLYAKHGFHLHKVVESQD